MMTSLADLLDKGEIKSNASSQYNRDTITTRMDVLKKQLDELEPAREQLRQVKQELHFLEQVLDRWDRENGGSHGVDGNGTSEAATDVTGDYQCRIDVTSDRP